jgi:hypothetical protein
MPAIMSPRLLPCYRRSAIVPHHRMSGDELGWAQYRCIYSTSERYSSVFLCSVGTPVTDSSTNWRAGQHRRDPVLRL